MRPVAEYAAVRVCACECIDCDWRAVHAEDTPCPDCGGLVLPIVCGICCLPVGSLDEQAIHHHADGPVHADCCQEPR